jgi:hypothetical protein
LSLQQATRLINKHRIDNDLDPFSNSAVYQLVLRLKPKAVPVRRMKQGSYDANSAWAQRRFANATQLLMRLELLDPNFDQTPEDTEGKSPDWFNTKAFDLGLLTAGKWLFQMQHVAVWDETHRKCVIGDGAAMAGRDQQLKFRRDASGKLNDSGEYSEVTSAYLNVKFEKEIRLCLGAVLVPGADNGEVTHGKMLKPFVYSGKLIITISDYNKKTAEEVRTSSSRIDCVCHQRVLTLAFVNYRSSASNP